jgi:hypothetical protein
MYLAANVRKQISEAKFPLPARNPKLKLIVFREVSRTFECKTYYSSSYEKKHICYASDPDRHFYRITGPEL